MQKQENRDGNGRFTRGQSGNPKERAPEVRKRATEAAAIAAAATTGEITPGEAAERARVVEIFVRAVETSDFEMRLQKREGRYGASA